jgi:hypothetical protein
MRLMIHPAEEAEGQGRIVIAHERKSFVGTSLSLKV